jgi:hypothetical protein
LGRDLVLALVLVSRVERISEIWTDLLQRPEVCSLSFPQQTKFVRLCLTCVCFGTQVFGAGVSVEALLSKRAPRKTLAARLTPDMENALFFMMNQAGLALRTDR